MPDYNLQDDEEISPAMVVRRVLVDAEVVQEPSNKEEGDQKPWIATVGHMPSEEECLDCVTLYYTAPVDEGRILATGRLVQRYGINIALRTGPRDYQRGWGRMRRIQRFLMEVRNRRVRFPTGVIFVLNSVANDTGPYYIGPEEQSRNNRFSLNVIANILRAYT